MARAEPIRATAAPAVHAQPAGKTAPASGHAVLERRREVQLDIERGRMLNARPNTNAQRALAAPLASGASAVAGDGDGEVVQLASKLIVVGGKKERKELQELTERESKEFGLPATLLADVSLGDVGAKDEVFLTGAHGSEADYADFASGAELAQALWDKGLRRCKGVVITGCSTGGGFSQQFYEAATKLGIVFEEYVTAPKTVSRTPQGRFVADTPEHTEYRRLTKIVADPELRDTEVGKAANTSLMLLQMSDYSKHVQNPVHLIYDMNQELDSIDRYYANWEQSRMDWVTYADMFRSYQARELKRIETASKVWATITTPVVAEQFKQAKAREPMKPHLADLSLFSDLGKKKAEKAGPSDRKDQKEKEPPSIPVAASTAAIRPPTASAAPIRAPILPVHGQPLVANASSSSSSTPSPSASSASQPQRLQSASASASPPSVAAVKPKPFGPTLEELLERSMTALTGSKPAHGAKPEGTAAKK